MGVAEVIRGRLADGELVIIDGGMGSQLQAEGVPMDEVAWSARANLEQPDVVQRVHEAYIQAGAEVIIAITFAASRAGLEPAGLGGMVADANRGAMRAALRARETGGWQPPNWVFDGLTPGEYLQQAITWAERGAQLIGGCCGTGPGHIRALADGLARRPAAR